jgi:hydroxymethylpyrimidine pyrophosphatase-like HAD family hydrolase
VALYRDGGRLSRWERADPATRRSRRIRIAKAFETLRQRFAQVRMSDDSHARTSDLALDIGESQRVPADVVLAMEVAAHDLGMRTFVSSVHMHLTLDPFDKATGTIAFFADRFGDDPTSARQHHAYVGDSANDAACFFAFETSVGVANIRPSLHKLSVPPRYVAEAPRGAGFAEICERILALRN